RIINRINSLRIRSSHGQLIHLNHIVDISEISRIVAVSVNHRTLMLHKLYDKLRNHSSISSVWVLLSPENIKVSKSYGFYTVSFAKDIRIKLIYVFSNRIRRERFPDFILNFRKTF